MNRPEYIVWHTAAAESNGKPVDQSATTIDAYHRSLGWSGIGYHWLVRIGGSVERGRPEGQAGAHVKGLNSRSIGICFAGHGDIAPFTVGQMRSGLALTLQIMERYGIPATCVIGHREINGLIDRGLLSPEYATSKTCPGTKTDMDAVRVQLGANQPAVWPVRFDETGERIGAEPRALQEAVNAVIGAGGPRGLTALTVDGWAGLKTSAACRAIMGAYLAGDPRE